MSNSVVRIYSVSSDYSVQHFSENELSRKNPSPGRSTLSFPMVPCWLEMKTNLSQRKRFWFQLFGAYFRTLSVAITHTPLPVLLLCRRLPNRNNFFVLFCLLPHFRGKQFIPDTHICCFGTPSPRPLQATSVRCCGRNAFDLDRKSCCRGSIQPLGYPCGCRGKKKTDPDRLCPL